MIQLIESLCSKVTGTSSYSKEKSDNFGEVFTPPELINEMLDKLPSDTWSDKTKTFFDPAAGKGNFPIEVIKRLFKGLESQIPSEEKRLKHIVENQIFMAELQDDSAEFIREQFKFGRDFRVNLYHGDSLSMPEGYFGEVELKEGDQIKLDFEDFFKDQMSKFK